MMHKVQQAILHDPENGLYGDCMRAAVASVLDLKLEEVPHCCGTSEKCKGTKWLEELQAFLFKRGLFYVEVTMESAEFIRKNFLVDKFYHIITGPSPRGNGYHAVVGCNGEIVWDPHPSQEGLKPQSADSVWYLGLLVPHNITGGEDSASEL